MTANERRTVDIFQHGLNGLDVADDRLAPGHDIADLNVIALLCGLIKGITSACRTPEDILLYSLADATEDLLVTAVIPTGGDVVKAWLKARGELLSCQLGGLRWQPSVCARRSLTYSSVQSTGNAGTLGNRHSPPSPHTFRRRLSQATPAQA